jgi:sirohydrochlorin ferrochelatase
VSERRGRQQRTPPEAGRESAPAVVLVDHGSREPAANAVLEQMAAWLRERLPRCSVQVAHMELAAPGLAEAIEACVADGAEEILVHPYFLAPGRHSTTDIPALAREAARRHPGVRVRVTGPLGAHPAITEAILERLSECGDRSHRG